MGLLLFIREYIAIAVLIAIGTCCFSFFFKDKIFLKWGWLLFLTISCAYLTRNFFISIIIFLGLIHVFVPKRPNIARLGYFLLLLPLIPLGFVHDIPFPGLEKLLALSYPRALSIFILLPIFFNSFGQPDKRLFSQPLDKYVILFFMYIFLMGFRDTTPTNAFRLGLTSFLDFFLIYFVVSRIVCSLEDFGYVTNAMVFSGFILALMAIFETAKGWHMYQGLLEIVATGFFHYPKRLGLSRAVGPFLNPIPYGVYFVVMLSGLTYLKFYESSRRGNYYNLIAGVFFAAILCTLSRGPLLGVAIFVFLFVTLAKQQVAKMLPLILSIFFVLFLSPISEVTISMLPFIGQKQQRTISYRKKLWSNSLEVIKKSPLTGSNTYMEEPEIQELREYGGSLKESKVDIVNSYLQVSLHHGIVGLALFILVLSGILLRLWRKSFLVHGKKEILLGKMLFSITLTMMVILGTVSTISFLGHYLWFVLGLGAAYACNIGDKDLPGNTI